MPVPRISTRAVLPTPPAGESRKLWPKTSGLRTAPGIAALVVRLDATRLVPCCGMILPFPAPREEVPVQG
ncbi:hypothetical protein GCM10009540_00930 [Streptomyces turgidiscabies]